MTPTAQLTPCLTRTAAPRGGAPLRLKLVAARLAAVGLLCLAAAATARGQNVQFTQGDVGSGLEHNISIPISAHPGRGAASLPLNLNYSSRVWRIGYVKTVTGSEPSLTPSSGRRATAEAIYGENSAAGWTTSLDPPRLEWPKPNDQYKYDGTAYNGTAVERYQKQHVYVHMPDGSAHELRKRDDLDGSDGNAREVGDFYAVDGSRLRYHGRPDTTGVLFMPDGARYEFQFGYETVQFIDRNGNKLFYDGVSRVWTDTLGRAIAQPWPANPQPGVDYTYTPSGYPAPYVFKWNYLSNVLTPGANGQPPPLRVVGNYYLPDPNSEPTNQTGGNNYPAAQASGTSALFTAMPEPALEGETITFLVGRGMSGGQTFNPVVLAEVVLPNGLSYKFTYNVYGEIDKTVYPTGGTDKYTYGGVGGFGLISPPYSLANRGVVLRQQSVAGDGVINSTWANSGGGPYVKTTMPDGTVKESYQYNFIPSDRNFGYQDARNGMTYDERVWDKDPLLEGAKMLRRTLTEWTQTIKTHTLRAATAPHPTVTYNAYRNARPVRSVSFNLDTGGQALAKLVTFVYDTNNSYKEMTTAFDRTVMTESHFAEVDPTVAKANVTDAAHPTAAFPDGLFLPASSSVTTYQDGLSYRQRNILGLATSVTLKDAAGNPVSKTETDYDQLPLIYYNDLGNDPFYEDPGTARGNPTNVRRYVDVNVGSHLETRGQFDQYGNSVYEWDARATSFDANTAVTTKEYAADYRHAYPTGTISTAPDPDGVYGSQTALTTSSTYDYVTGLLLSTTDANGQPTSLSYSDDTGAVDPMNRVRKVTRPDDSWTKTSYNDVPGNLYVHTETQLDATRNTHGYQFYDGLGRASRLLARELGSNYVVSETQYDNMGRVRQTSNPIRTTIEGTGGDARYAAYWETNSQPSDWTQNEYDELGRVRKVTLPDGSYVTTLYDGVYTTVTDQAGRQRRQKTNGLGRIIRVDEPDANGSLGGKDTPARPSFYEYDTLGNIVRLSQGLSQPGLNPEDSNSYVQRRFFKYDALSRLTHEKQAEQVGDITTPADPLTGNPSWSRRLTYDETRDGVSFKGQLSKAEDARHVYTFFHYDRLGRTVRVDHSDGTPSVTSKYDQMRTDAPPAGGQEVVFKNRGRLTEVTTGAVTTAEGWTIPQTQQLYDYDLMGRTRRQRQAVGANSYEVRYEYNLSGGLISQRYPSGRVVTYGFDDAGRLLSAGSGATAYASQMTYEPFGALKSMTLGNGAVYSMAYDAQRAQLSSISLTQGANVLQKYEYKYGAVNMATGAVDASKNNGQIASIDSTVGAQRQSQQRFQYDSLGRLASAGEHYGGTLENRSYLLNYDYDVYGNRYQKATSNQDNQVAQSWVEDGAYAATTNRLTSGLTYDNAGNVTVDARFRLRKYEYDANNRQRRSANLDDSGAVRNVYNGGGQRVATVAGGNVTRVMVYDMAGALMAEYGGAAFANGTRYVMGDQQGSTRLTMRSAPLNGQLVVARQDYLPFGEEVAATVGPRAGIAGYEQQTGPRQKYAGMEQDEATGMSHTLWREYDSLSARWTAPDPYGGSMSLDSPQTFNRYVYCNNDPVNQTDPLGLMAASQGWSSVSSGFWGGDPGFFDPHFGGPGIIAEAQARFDQAIADTRTANHINQLIKAGAINKKQAKELIKGNRNLSLEQTSVTVLDEQSGPTVDPVEFEGKYGPAPLPRGTMTVRNGIREHTDVDIDQECNGRTGGACTSAVALTQSISANNGRDWAARNVDLRIYGDMWVSSGPYPYRGRTPVDRTVVDATTARAHEYNAHVDVAIEAVRPIINEFLGRTFRSQQEFQSAADQMSNRVSNSFRNALRQTQNDEVNRR